jgi:hypothetical protein
LKKRAAWRVARAAVDQKSAKIIALAPVNDASQSKGCCVQKGDVVKLIAVVDGGQETIQYQSSDAWLLLAIIYAGQKKPAALSDIIAAADAINHALITFPEMEGGLARLETGGYIIDQNSRFSPTEKTMSYYRSKNRCHMMKAMEDLKTLLDTTPWDPSYKSGMANKGFSYPPLTPELFNQAEKEYLARFSAKKKSRGK